MSSITIHALDVDLDLRLTEEAKRNKKSKNKLVKELLAHSLGMASGGSFSDDYREFCGLWNPGERAVFEAVQVENSRVDEADWQA